MHTLPDNFTLHTLNANEADELFDFYVTIDEFAHIYKGQAERFREGVKENLKKDSTAYVLKDANNIHSNGKSNHIVSSVQAGAQCSYGYQFA